MIENVNLRLFSKTFFSFYMAIQVMVFFALGELLLAYPFGILLRDWRKESFLKKFLSY